MSGCCSIRALWILNAQDTVVFSRRFPVVEKRWRLACERQDESSDSGDLRYAMLSLLPTDAELASAFAEKKKREGSAHGFGIRVNQSAQGTDSWIDDPVTRHIISLSIDREEKLAYSMMIGRPDCGNFVGGEESLSSLLLDLPCITGAFMVAHTIGDIITGDSFDTDVVISSSPSVGGLLDSLTGSIGISSISARAKPVAAPVSTSSVSNATATGSASSDAPKSTSRPIDKDSLRTFISSSMPFGTPLDVNYSNISAIKLNGFSSSDLSLADLKQPAWKPYLYKGKQRILFTIHEIIHAALYDRDEILDTISISGQVNCRAELEGLPDASFPLTGLSSSHIEVLSFHHCAQVPEQGVDKQAIMFSPPLGNFVLIRYQTSSGLSPPVKGFYQLSMVSEDEGAFLFKLRLMEGYKAPLSMEFCTVTMPFLRRRLAFFDGNPSIGTVSTTDHSIEWKIITGGRGIMGKSIEATFPGTIRFLPWSGQRYPPLSSAHGNLFQDESDIELECSNNMVNSEEFLMEKMNKDLPSVDLDEPFCWQAYNYAKVSFKVVGGTLSGKSIDPKSVSIYPPVKAPVELSMQGLYSNNIEEAAFAQLM